MNDNETAWLDNKDRLARIDPSNMLEKVERFPDMLEQAYQIGKDLDLSSFKDIRSVAIFGMGGSAVGGDFMKSYAYNLCSAPISVIRGYTIPKCVDSNTLAIVSSYSGNTEETLSCYEQAIAQKAQIVCVTSGGEVAKIARQHGHALIEIPGGLPPRSALGYSFGPMIRLFAKLGLLPCQDVAVAETVAVLRDCVKKYGREVETSDNPAKLLAWKLFERLPVVYSSSSEYEAAVVRWKGQLAENSKVLSIGHVIPEMNHNEIVGWSGLKPITEQMEVVLLRDQKEHPQTSKRFEASKEIMGETPAGISEFYSEGKGLLARTFSFVSLGDFVSVYLAILNQEDPTPVKPIDFLKEFIAKKDRH